MVVWCGESRDRVLAVYAYRVIMAKILFIAIIESYVLFNHRVFLSLTTVLSIVPILIVHLARMFT